MENRYEKSFDQYVCEGDTISAGVGKFTITARIVRDTDSHIDDDDTHNIDQTVTGCNDDQQANLVAARKAWFNDEWFYCGVVLSVSLDDILLDDIAASLWGIEANYPCSDNSYLTEVANELLDDALTVAENERKRILKALQD